jgi:Flp pilus assembly protein TadG
MGGARLRQQRAERGAAAVEFALIVPFLLMLIFFIVSYAYMFSFRQTMSQAASEGARAAVGASTGTACPVAGPFVATGITACPAQYAASAAVANSMSGYNMSCGSSYLTCSISAPTTAGCTSGHSCVTVTVSYPYAAHNLLPAIPGFGFGMPSNLSFTSVVVTS